MHKTNFDQVVEDILREDSRYDFDAYIFVREGLDFTLKLLKRSNNSTHRHVAGKELLDGLRQYCIKEFGPMTKMVLNEWGIMRCEDFGQIVFNLVKHGVLGKSDNDRIEDFSEVFTFEDAFEKPFLPTPVEKKVKRETSLSKESRISRVSEKKNNLKSQTPSSNSPNSKSSGT